MINNVNEINKKYFSTGINDEGLQELSDKSYMTFIIKDKIGKIWREFKPPGIDKKEKKLLLIAHNNHISTEIYDEDDEEDEQEEFKSIELLTSLKPTLK